MPHRIPPSKANIPEPESPIGIPPSNSKENIPVPESLTGDSPEAESLGIDLSGCLQHLSLETSSEIRSVDPEPVGFNPFEVYLQAESGEQPQPRFVEHLVRDVIRPQLEGLRQCRWFEIEDLHALYESARKFQMKWNVPETSFQNFCTLLSGCLDFPSILLLNPSPLDHLPFDEMLEESPTLLWLQDVLRPMHLTIRDIIVFDTFPMVTDDFMDQLSEENRRNFVLEAFDLTLLCLSHIRPQILISCQCGTQPLNVRWGFVDHTVARNLCSSVSNARAQRVRAVNVESHAIHVVQGFHPNYVVKMMRSNAGFDLDTMLQDLFQRVFQPFGDWKSDRDAMEREIQESATLVRAGLLVQLSQVKQYRRACQRNLQFGIAGPVSVERVEEVQSLMEEWIRWFSV